MPLIPDLREFIELLNSAGIRYVIVGGWACNFYAAPRATGDIDFFVSADPLNEQRLREVLQRFGFADALPAPHEPLLLPGKILMLGRQPNRIDILTSIDAVPFEEAWATRQPGTLDGLPVSFISRELLIRNKRAARRSKDAADADVLENIECTQQRRRPHRRSE